MEVRNWTPQQIGDMTLYQFYLACGVEPKIQPWATPEQVEAENVALRERLAAMAEKEKTMRSVEW